MAPPKREQPLGKNNTATELESLKKIEQAFYRNNKSEIKRNTQKSLDWFRKYIPKAMNSIRTAQMFRDRKLWKSKMTMGCMYFFEYDPIHKDTLPIYDRYPLIFPITAWKNDRNGGQYFLGINLHYLQPALRLKAMQALLTLRNEKRYRRHTKLLLEWDLLKGMGESPLFEDCVKMYKLDHVKTTFINIPSQSWEMAVFLPLARFVTNAKKGGKHPWQKKRKLK